MYILFSESVINKRATIFGIPISLLHSMRDSDIFMPDIMPPQRLKIIYTAVYVLGRATSPSQAKIAVFLL